MKMMMNIMTIQTLSLFGQGLVGMLGYISIMKMNIRIITTSIILISTEEKTVESKDLPVAAAMRAGDVVVGIVKGLSKNKLNHLAASKPLKSTIGKWASMRRYNPLSDRRF